jgi:hypothetical protein
MAAHPSEVDRNEEAPLARLPRVYYWACLATGVVLFLFVSGPIWNHAWHFDRLNRAILYSYLPLPFIVAGALVVTRRFSLRAFFLDAVEITLLKYSLTFGLALVLWTLHDPPPEPPRPPSRAQALEPAPRPTPIDPARAGAVRGEVVDERGMPVAGALVFVEAGLESFVFAPRERASLVLEHRGAGVEPRLAAAQIGQRIDARSADGKLHTLVARSEQGTVFNVPLLPAGVPRPLELSAPHLMTLSCGIHPGSEASSELAVFAHPFFALTGEDGAFRFEGVPEGDLVFAARRASAHARSRARVAGGRDTRVSLRL